MYCPNCGTENAEDLNYCTRCGESLSQQSLTEKPKVNYGKMASMFWAVAIFGFVSLATLVGCLIPLTLFHAAQDVIMMALVLGFITIFGIGGLLIRQLSRVISLVQGEADPQGQKRTLRPPARYTGPQLPPQPRAVSSITENTTRNFEAPSYREPGARE